MNSDFRFQIVAHGEAFAASEVSNTLLGAELGVDHHTFPIHVFAA